MINFGNWRTSSMVFKYSNWSSGIQIFPRQKRRTFASKRPILTKLDIQMLASLWK
jgi:hypothetical protein